jgi:hypothetical protein
MHALRSPDLARSIFVILGQSLRHIEPGGVEGNGGRSRRCSAGYRSVTPRRLRYRPPLRRSSEAWRSRSIYSAWRETPSFGAVLPSSFRQGARPWCRRSGANNGSPTRCSSLDDRSIVSQRPRPRGQHSRLAHPHPRQPAPIRGGGGGLAALADKARVLGGLLSYGTGQAGPRHAGDRAVRWEGSGRRATTGGGQDE